MMDFSQPHSLTALYKMATPMFLGGEGQLTDSQKFRNASFKGALRFWWRALNWGRVLKESSGDTTGALKALHDQEGALFGLANDGQNSCQSMLSIHATLQDVKLQQPREALKELGYLLGQGLYKTGITRPYLEGGTVQVLLQFKPGTPPAQVQAVRQAATALGLLGGLGSRARRGLGSLSLQSITGADGGVQTFTGMQQIQDFIATLDFSAPGSPPFSALSQTSRIDVSAHGDTAVGILAAINTEMQLYRSYGQNGKVNGQEARRNFVADHDNVLAATQGRPLAQLPERAVFGLPHNYFFSSTRAKADINPAGEGRRASPLLIHIHVLDGGKFVAIQTLLPGVFLPQGMAVDVKTRAKQSLTNTSVDYAVIGRYLDGFGKRSTLRAPQRG